MEPMASTSWQSYPETNLFSNSVCSTCLNGSRRLILLSECPHLTKICNGLDLSYQDQVCWECKAILNKTWNFRQKAIKSKVLLTRMAKVNQTSMGLFGCHSSLQSTQTDIYSTVTDEAEKVVTPAPKSTGEEVTVKFDDLIKKFLSSSGKKMNNRSMIGLPKEEPRPNEVSKLNEVPKPTMVKKEKDGNADKKSLSSLVDDILEQELGKMSHTFIPPSLESYKSTPLTQLSRSSVVKSLESETKNEFLQPEPKDNGKEVPNTQNIQRPFIEVRDDISKDSTKPQCSETNRSDTAPHFVETNVIVKAMNADNVAPISSDGNARAEVQSYEDYIITRLITVQEMLKMRERERSELLASAFRCDKCIELFLTQRSYDEHMLLHDASRGSLVCNVCELRFKHERDLTNHIKMHYTCYECRECGYQFRERSNLVLHWNMTHQATVLSRKRKPSLTSHLPIKKQADRIPQTFECDICTKEFTTKQAHTYHMLLHEQGTPMECEVCHREYKSEAQLKTHFKRAHETVDPDLAHCSTCDQSFGSGHLYRLHVKTHPKPDQIKCSNTKVTARPPAVKRSSVRAKFP